MALQGLDQPHVPGASPDFNAFVAGVRLFMRDFPELNRLVSGEESNDRMIAFSVYDAISDFNSTPPLISIYGFADFMRRGWGHPLRLGTVISLLESVGILQTRNHLPFSDGGLNVAVSDKTPLLQSWIQLLGARWERFKTQVKVSDNIGSILNSDPAGVNSELFFINGYWYADY